MAVRITLLVGLIKPRMTVVVPILVDCIEQGYFDNLCWASCVAMAAKQQGLHPCDIQTIAKQFLNCDVTELCDIACDANRVACAFATNGLVKVVCSDPIEESALVAQISSGNTVAVGLEGTPNHMILIVGLGSDSTESVFFVCDPANGFHPAKFGEINSYLGSGVEPKSWKLTWYNLKKG